MVALYIEANELINGIPLKMLLCYLQTVMQQ